MTRARSAGLAATLTLAAYSQAPRASFQFDDWNVILRDPAALSLAGWWSRMPGIRPLLKLSYAVCASLGFGSRGFHAVNVGIHVGCVLVVFLILHRLARIHGAGDPGDPRDPGHVGGTVRGSLPERRAVLTALVGSLLFALHPVQTEAVTYACGRSVSLAALLALGSMAVWIEGRERGRRFLTYAASPLLAAAAIATKEFTLVIPAALLLIVLCDPRRARRRGEAARILAVHGPVLLAGLLVILASPVYRRLLATSLAIRDIGTNLRTQSTAIVWLCGQLLRPGHLVADPKLPVAASWTPSVLAASTAIAALLVLAIACIRRRPAVALGVLWFFLWIAPTNSFLPRFDIANDRQLYVALIGPAWLLGRVLAPAMAARRAVLAVFLVAAAGLGAASFVRNRVYFTEIGFWEDVVVKAPHNARAHNNLGYAYALACRKSDAEAALATTWRLDPSDYTAPINLSMLRDGSLPGYREACGSAGSMDVRPDR